MEIDITDRTACNISNCYVHWLDIIRPGDSGTISWLYTNLLDGRCEEQATPILTQRGELIPNRQNTNPSRSSIHAFLAVAYILHAAGDKLNA